MYTLQADPYGRDSRDQAGSADWADVLARFPFFEHVGRRRLGRLVRHATAAEYAPGDLVIAAGTPGDSVQVVLGGSARVLGKPAARALRTGDLFGELSLLSGTPRTATVVAATELHVLSIPREAFLELARKDPGLLLDLLSMLGSQFARLESRAA